MKAFLGALVLAAAFALSGGQADAVSLNFEDEAGGILGGGQFRLTTTLNGPVQVNPGNCASGQCLLLRAAGPQSLGEVVTLSRVDNAVFSVTSFWFKLLGNGNTASGNTLNVGEGVAEYTASNYTHNVGYNVSVAGLFDNITSLTFRNVNGGNIRIDDIQIAPVPLPAAGLLLLAAIGGLGLMRRRHGSASPVAA